jgi:hypothetical protein
MGHVARMEGMLIQSEILKGRDYLWRRGADGMSLHFSDRLCRRSVDSVSSEFPEQLPDHQLLGRRTLLYEVCHFFLRIKVDYAHIYILVTGRGGP